MRVNFGISYNGNLNTFQPDFIVKFTDGAVGIFDTKGIDLRVEDTKVKAEALYKYLEDTNAKRKIDSRVIGGIVIKHNSQFYYYNQSEYHDFKADKTNWICFNNILLKIRTNKR